MPSSTISTTSSPSFVSTSTDADVRLRVLGDIGEALRDDVVRRNLERLGKPALDVDLQLHGHRGPRGELLERDCEPVAADDRRVQASGDLAQLCQRSRDLSPGPVDPRLDVRVAVDSPLEHAQLEGERDEPLLRAVVEVALEQLPLTLRRLDDARAGAAELLEPGPQLGVEPGVLERDPGRGLHTFEQLGLIVERRVVDQRSRRARRAGR